MKLADGKSNSRIKCSLRALSSMAQKSSQCRFAMLAFK